MSRTDAVHQDDTPAPTEVRRSILDRLWCESGVVANPAAEGTTKGPFASAEGVVPETPALEVQGLCKTFVGQRALSGVSMALAPGEIRGLVGQNGSGKSTLIKVLAGFYTPDDGA